LTQHANGNLTRDETGRQFVYDAWNRLVEVKDDSGNTLKSYAYDGQHRRIQETAGGTTTNLYYSDAWQVLEERVASGGTSVPRVQYVWSPVYVDALVLRDRDSTGDGTLDERLYVVQDANYNVTALFDNSGSVVERYAYDPFGQVTVLDAGWSTLAGSAFGWVYLHQGDRFDATNGLYHFRHRDYSPTLGRWTSLDPLRYDAGDVNLYRVVFNAPTIYTDPSGQILPLLVIGGVLLAGAGIGGLHYAASRYDCAREHYLSRPIEQWTPEVQAEYRDYVRTTDWIAAGSEVAGWTGVSMVATPYLSYGSGYLWSAGGTGGRIFVGTVGVGGLGSMGYGGYTIYRDWGMMEGPERFRRVGNLAGPTLVGLGVGPRYFHQGLIAGRPTYNLGGVTGEIPGAINVQPPGAPDMTRFPGPYVVTPSHQLPFPPGSGNVVVNSSPISPQAGGITGPYGPLGPPYMPGQIASIASGGGRITITQGVGSPGTLTSGQQAVLAAIPPRFHHWDSLRTIYDYSYHNDTTFVARMDCFLWSYSMGWILWTRLVGRIIHDTRLQVC
jgi:RHS repeat-associated protein